MDMIKEIALGPLLKGFGLGAGLIIAIGAQNAFVLRQGLQRSHVLATALVCTLCDVALIVLGVGGLGTLIAGNTALETVATWGGIGFLLLYAVLSFRSAFAPNLDTKCEVRFTTRSLPGTVLATLGISLLNPHVYLDTVMLIGSVGAQFPPRERVLFASGAAIASSTWFFCLAYGAARLNPIFQRPLSWKVLNVITGCAMLLVALSLT